MSSMSVITRYDIGTDYTENRPSGDEIAEGRTACLSKHRLSASLSGQPDLAAKQQVHRSKPHP